MTANYKTPHVTTYACPVPDDKDARIERLQQEVTAKTEMYHMVVNSVCAALERAGIEAVDDPGEAIDVLLGGLQSRLADAQQDSTSLLHLLALIREACGDNGKRMQDELVTFIRDEREGHLAHIALLKASLKQAGRENDAALKRVKALEDGLRECTKWAAPGSNAKRIAAALLEVK